MMKMSAILDSSKNVNTNLPVSNLVEYLSKIFDVEQARSAVLQNVDKIAECSKRFCFHDSSTRPQRHCNRQTNHMDQDRITRTNYRNRPSFVEDLTKNILAYFFSYTRFIYLQNHVNLRKDRIKSDKYD